MPFHKQANLLIVLFLLYVIIHRLWIVPASERELSSAQIERIEAIMTTKSHDISLSDQDEMHTPTFHTSLDEDRAVLQYITANKDLRFKEVVVQQWLHESDSLRSRIYKECNNGFGMKIAVIRKTTNIGECRGHARYSSKLSSAEDYFLWQQFELPAYERKIGRRIKTAAEYYKFLEDRKYAEDPQYIKKLKLWAARLGH